MCSIPGLPSPGSNVTVLITRVNLNPLCVLVEFWGNFDQERKLAYQRMRKEIQFPREIFRESEGNPGELCLVQIYETWYRARIVSRNVSNYSVFLIDEGRTLTATTSMLAWGQNDFFHLPPEVEFCVLANVLPLSPENRWSPMALEFLKTLCGRTVNACVQDVLVPHRTFLLDIPCLSRQMYEMGFAKKLSTERFKEFVARSLQSHSEPIESQKISCMRNESMEVIDHIEKHQHQCYMYPELQTETVETVIVTEVTNPLRVFCQLKVFSQELKKLTEQITQHYEGRVGMRVSRPETLGSPCASRGSDGKWYRSVLQQVMASNNVVEVLQVDYGKKLFVQVENIRPLAAEFFRMPVVTYVCSLHGIIDKGVGWTAAQIDFLKSLLLNRTVIAKFEYQSLSEGVHYVTLYGDENTNINNLFGMKEKCLLESEKSHGDYAVVKSTATQKPLKSAGNEVQRTTPPSTGVLMETEPRFPTESLPLNTSHVAVVQHVDSPSQFWVQTQRYADEFDQLMDNIAELYSSPASAQGLVRKPTVGLICAAKSHDDVLYRAIVRKIVDQHVEVYFIDYGNTELIDWFNLRVLPPNYQQLPALALKCTLSGIRVKSDDWSPKATLFFSKAVEDKVLGLHISAKCHGTHVVQLTDPKSDGEKDLSKLLCNAGFAERDELSKPASVAASRTLILPTAQDPKAKSFDMYKMSSGPQTLSTSAPAVTETRSAFKEHLFPIGSSVEVTVSYIDSPNDFWCQIANNAGCLKLLMQDIQNYYANSEFQHPVEAACVARHPENRMWYRALAIQKHQTPHVDVLFIDYGQTKTVALQELRHINPAFLKLKGQAFRCSLYNLIHPVSHSTVEWSDEATLQFQEFVDTANVVLKCTIYAVMYNSQKVVFNVVDLETPFQSVCSLLVQRGLANRAPPKKAPLPPFRLDTYYYSTHNIKTGSEEEMGVTCVKSVNNFYCQLGRNSDLVEGLANKVNYLCRQLESINCPQTFGTVCFAKYTDGEWYRGQIKSAKPSITVHFVDYGDTLEVDKSDLLPIPIEASEIMSVPVQAVECGLSDIPADVSSAVNSWFESQVNDRTFKALVVAKEPGGKLMVELYDGKTQVNAMIKEKFHIEVERKEQVVFMGYNSKSRNSQDVAFKVRDGPNPEKAHQIDEAGKRYENPTPAFKRSDLVPRRTEGNWRAPSNGGLGSEPSEAVRKPNNHQRQVILDTSEAMKKNNNQRQVIPEAESKHTRAPWMSLDESGRDNCTVPKTKIQTVPKLADLPSKSIKPGVESEVIVSHCNSPWSFFIQLITDEDEIYSLVEKLNDDQSSSTHIKIKDLHEGDLVNAEFPDDNSWYRAVVRETTDNDSVHVEFIDFGNTARVSASKIFQLAKPFLAHPRFSIHCSLSEVLTVDKTDQEVVTNFKKEIEENVDTVMCRFVKHSGIVWEVKLEANGKALGCKFFSRVPTGTSDSASERQDVPNAKQVLPENPTRDPCDNVTTLYTKPDISEGQTVEVYASFIVGPRCFWCQNAESDKLQEITDIVQETGNAVKYEAVSGESLSVGGACMALFADEQWYRAEVMAKDAGSLSILFVDYGNDSKVNLSEVRALPPQLSDVPPQAFLCRLEGFDPSQGYWNESAADQFFELLTDKLLKLTVLRVGSPEDGKTPHFVKVECDEQVINDTMKDYWKSSTSVGHGESPKIIEEPALTEGNFSCEFPQLTIESESVEQEDASDLSPEETTLETATAHDLNDSVIQSFESQTTEPESVDVCQCTEVLDEQQAMPVISMNENNIQEEDMDLVCAQEDKEELDEHDLECTTESIVDAQMGEGEELLSEQHEMEDLTVVEDPKLKDELIDERKEDQPKCPSESTSQTDLPTKAQGASTESHEIPSALIPPKISEQADLDGPFESSVLVVLDPDFSSNDMDTDPMLYIDENFEETLPPQDPSQDDLYEDVFKYVQPLSESPEAGPASPDQVNQEKELEDNQEIQSDFGKLRRAAERPPVGSECVVWSLVNKNWCRAKILKISKDSTLVLLLERDSEMVVDPHNIFENAKIVSEEPTLDPCVDTHTPLSNEQNKETDTQLDLLDCAPGEKAWEEEARADVCASLEEPSKQDKGTDEGIDAQVNLLDTASEEKVQEEELESDVGVSLEESSEQDKETDMGMDALVALLDGGPKEKVQEEEAETDVGCSVDESTEPSKETDMRTGTLVDLLHDASPEKVQEEEAETDVGVSVEEASEPSKETDMGSGTLVDLLDDASAKKVQEEEAETDVGCSVEESTDPNKGNDMGTGTLVDLLDASEEKAQKEDPTTDVGVSVEESSDVVTEQVDLIDLTSDAEEESGAASEDTLQGETAVTERSTAAEESFEVQMSLVTHLTLKVEDTSDDDVIFVSEMRVAQSEADEPSSEIRKLPQD